MTLTNPIVIAVVVTIVAMALPLAILIDKYSKTKELNKKMLDQLVTSDMQYSSLERELQEARAGRHDYKNHLKALKGLIAIDENDEAQRYLDNLIEENSDKRGAISCGNSIVNSILNTKAQEMQEKNILFKNDSVLPRRLNLQPSHITLILSNLLDNAITASTACPFSYVDLQLKHSKGNLVIMIKNPYVGKLVKNGNSYNTTKPDKHNHGIGLRSVIQTVNRLTGTIDIEHDSGIFSVFVMVPA